MIVAGVMSGTSADGINVALVRIGETLKSSSRKRFIGAARLERKPGRTTIELIGHSEYPYPARVRAAILAAMNAEEARVADLARLSFALGELYADAVLSAQQGLRSKIDLVGCHGQTLYHQGNAQPFLGKRVAATWQSGEAAIIAARVGVPVVSDFRPSDMAAGGKGAPLVPYLDYLLFRDSTVGRVVQNIGGIANLTAIPAKAGPDRTFAFDTGPGNMVIDALMENLFGRPFDRGGNVASCGQPFAPVIAKMLKRSFFRERPPKTAGREEFGREFVREFLRQCGRAHKPDIIATATALTAKSIADAVQRFVVTGASTKDNYREMILSGGGARNALLVSMLRQNLAHLGLELRLSDDLGLPSQAKEAVAFAILAYETWNRRPSNVPSATGAKGPAVLGKLCYAYDRDR
jgi:anhydro-N-acetylmuramic acid kinase